MDRHLITELLYNYIDFKTMMKLRVSNKQISTTYEDEYYWKIINLTDTSIADSDYLIKTFTNNSITIYNLSGNNRTILCIPSGILKKISNTKLLIF